MKPRRVVHQFDPPNGLAIHTYLWDRQFESRLATSGSARIAFYSREAVLDGTWRLADERPLIVDVFGAGEVLPLNAATGDR